MTVEHCPTCPADGLPRVFWGAAPAFTRTASLALAVLAASCGGEERPPGPAPPAAARPAPPSRAAALLRGSGAYDVRDVQGGALEVVVTYLGDPVPVPAEVPVTGGPGCAKKVLLESLLVDAETRGLRNAVFKLEGITAGKPSVERVAIEVRDCAFVPHVAGVMKGTRLEARSADPVPHTLHARLHGESLFNLPLNPGEAPPGARPMPQAGYVEIGCDRHSFMRGFVAVHTSPYIEVTDARGRARMEGVPPGRHAYTVWHEQLGEKHGEVEVAAGGTATLQVVFEAPR